MIVGWDSKTDTFFISGMTDTQSLHLCAAMKGLLRVVKECAIPWPDVPSTKEEYISFLKDVGDGLFTTKEIKEAML